MKVDIIKSTQVGNLKVDIIKSTQVGNLIEVKFKYWNDDDCACTAKKITRTFETYPTTQQLISSI